MKFVQIPKFSLKTTTFLSKFATQMRKPPWNEAEAKLNVDIYRLYMRSIDVSYRNVPKFSDRQVWANSVDTDQSDQGLHCLPFASFGCISQWKIHMSRPVKWHENRGSVTKKQIWSHHMNFCKKSHENLKFLLLGSKGFCKAVLVCHLRALKTLISLGTWFLYRVYQIRKPSVTEILHSLFTYTPVRDDPNDNRCTYNIDSQYCLLLNILGDTSFSDIKHI